MTARPQPDRAPGLFPDEDLPEGAVVTGESLERDVDLAFDYVVIGSGAAGAVAAHTLVVAGYSVAILEEGPWVKTREFTEDVYSTFTRLLRGKGMQVIKGRSYMPLLQGRCVGGSTLVNSAIAWRVPEDVIDDWAERFGLGDTFRMADLEPHFEALERDLSARPVADDVLGENNRLFLETAEKHGIHANAMKRYEKNCRGSGLCLTGCPHGAKQSMNVTYVPWALHKGARIFTSCRAERAVLRGHRAVGVLARSESGRRVELRARLGVIVAASTIQTPNILARSGVRSRALGMHFQAHPGLALGGVFERPIDMTFGATQGAESIHFRKTDRFKLETIAMPPELAAARIPGIGEDLSRRLAQLGHTAVWAVQIRVEAEGTVSPGWGGTDDARLTLTKKDLAAARKAATTIARFMFDAGAREVWPGIYGVPSVITSMDDVKALEDAPLEPRSYNLIATHLFGTTRMGPDPRASVVGLDFAVHGTDGLYVVDSGIFPTNLGVNPQHTIMALSRLAAERIASRRSSFAVA